MKSYWLNSHYSDGGMPVWCEGGFKNIENARARARVCATNREDDPRFWPTHYTIHQDDSDGDVIETLGREGVA